MPDRVHVFEYDAARMEGIASEKVRDATVQGTIFDVEGVGPALMLAGHARVRGEVRRIDAADLARIDGRARVSTGLYRRVGVRVGDTPCWVWIAGPKLAQRLAAARQRPVEVT